VFPIEGLPSKGALPEAFDRKSDWPDRQRLKAKAKGPRPDDRAGRCRRIDGNGGAVEFDTLPLFT
jgi:hypothetical protein